MYIKKEISSLENRLDKALIKYNEAQSIKKMYEQIIKKLQEEQLTFDQQLAYYEKTLKIKKQDIIELESMSRDANHAKEIAKVYNKLKMRLYILNYYYYYYDYHHNYNYYY